MPKVICSKSDCCFNCDNECTLDTVILEVYPGEDSPAACACSDNNPVPFTTIESDTESEKLDSYTIPYDTVHDDMFW